METLNFHLSIWTMIQPCRITQNGNLRLANRCQEIDQNGEGIALLSVYPIQFALRYRETRIPANASVCFRLVWESSLDGRQVFRCRSQFGRANHDVPVSILRSLPSHEKPEMAEAEDCDMDTGCRLVDAYC